MTKPITPEMSAAWRKIQAATHLHPSLREAVDVLDNSDYMVPLERAEEDASPAVGEPLDPAEWGDTTREDIARHQQAQDAAIIAAGGEVHVTRMALDDLHGEGLLDAIRKSKAKRNKS